MFDDHPSVQLLIDARTGRIVRVNDAATAFYGYDEERLRRMKLTDLIVDPPEEANEAVQALATGERTRVVTRQCARHGDRRHVEVAGTVIETGDEPPLVHVILRDVTERVNFESALRDYREIFENVPVPFYRASRGATGRFLRFNPAFARLFEADPPEQLFECDIASLYVDPNERERFSNALMEHGQVYRYELQLRTLKGRVIWCADTAYEHLDEQGNHVFDGVLEDITRQRELEHELAYQARYDELTGLANRRHCENMLEAEIERCDRYGPALSALMLDLDHFKQINDDLGHAEGDRVLERSAGIIQRQVRQTDLAARWGGEEFVVLLPSTGTWGAQQLAEKLRRSIAEHSGDDGPSVTISVGFAEYARGEGKDRFLGRLDRSLYAAKNAGRNRVVQAESATVTGS